MEAQQEELISWKKMREITESPRGKLFQGWLQWSDNIDLPPIHRKDVILDIGCGPQGIIQTISKGIRVGIDPLISKYRSTYQMPADINFVVGVGEYLPFKDNKVDLIFMINTLDHVINPKKVLVEVRRVCKRFLILDTNTTPLSDKFMMKVGYKHPLDIYHPHNFTAEEVIKLLNSAKFKILDIKYSGSNTRPAFLLSPVLSFFKKTKQNLKIDSIWCIKGKIHLIVKKYFLNIINFPLFRINKKKFADNIKIIAQTLDE
jgi:2-polyprenyl-3-methyl-5-hydroxy-6-metoxy-1,4-benzoquinol methylase